MCVCVRERGGGEREQSVKEKGSESELLVICTVSIKLIGKNKKTKTLLLMTTINEGLHLPVLHDVHQGVPRPLARGVNPK